MKGKHSKNYEEKDYIEFDENETPKAFRKDNYTENTGEQKRKMGKKQTKHKKK